MPGTDTFELFRARFGGEVDDRTGVHVRVRAWIRPRGLEHKDGIVCLTAEADRPEQLDAQIDALIEELETLKEVGRREFSKLEHSD